MDWHGLRGRIFAWDHFRYASGGSTADNRFVKTISVDWVSFGALFDAGQSSAPIYIFAASARKRERVKPCCSACRSNSLRTSAGRVMFTQTLFTSSARAGDRNAILVHCIGHDLFERRGLWNGFTILSQSSKMKGRSFRRHLASFVQSTSCADDPRRSGNETP